ncbi:hypothetical protein GCM10027570_11050 [Streptomonospora sediminis]
MAGGGGAQPVPPAVPAARRTCRHPRAGGGGRSFGTRPLPGGAAQDQGNH